MKAIKCRGIFDARPIILLGVLDWPAKKVEGSALYDVLRRTVGTGRCERF
jgi:hypothetical protein